MKTRPTQEQIDAEIAALPDCKDLIPEIGMMGNNHNAIDAAVVVLKRKMGNDDVYDTWGEEGCEAAGEEFDQTVLDGALDALNWMNGTDPKSPSEKWKE